jgi:hypothetical protein
MNLSPSFWATEPRLFLDGNNDSGSAGASNAAEDDKGDGQNADTSGNGGAQGDQNDGQSAEAKGTLSQDGKTVTIDGKTFVVQDHVNHLVGQARTEGKTTAEREIERKRTEQEAKDKGEFEALANQYKARIDELEADAAKRDREDLKRTVGKKHGLGDEAIARLQGDDEAALEVDAKALAKLLGARKAPDTEGGVGAGATSSVSDRPIDKKPAQQQGAGTEPAYTFQGQPKVAWPSS